MTPTASNPISVNTLSAEDDVQGYLVVNAIIGVLIGLLVPAVQKEPRPNGFTGVSAGASGTLRQ